jgi:hypothetical protein
MVQSKHGLIQEDDDDDDDEKMPTSEILYKLELEENCARHFGCLISLLIATLLSSRLKKTGVIVTFHAQSSRTGSIHFIDVAAH